MMCQYYGSCLVRFRYKYALNVGMTNIVGVIKAVWTPISRLFCPPGCRTYEHVQTVAFGFASGSVDMEQHVI